MPAGFEASFARVKELVADFRANEKFYLSPAYQEMSFAHWMGEGGRRPDEGSGNRDFIDKFWLALGWDVNHETQKNPFEQEVKVERKEHGFSQRRADYAFYLAPNFRDVKFYVEAKKPHGDIATADNYFQTIRYGWSSSTPVAVLHDFEQFEISVRDSGLPLPSAHRNRDRAKPPQIPFQPLRRPGEIRGNLLALLPRSRRRQNPLADLQ